MLKILQAGSLRHQMMLYFVFIAVVSATLAIELTVLVRGPSVCQAILDATGVGSEYIQPVEGVLNYLLAKIGLAFGILVLTVLLVLTLFIKRVTIPLETILDGAARISRGDLSVNLRVHTHDELGRLASLVNELAANYQEILRIIEHDVDAAREKLHAMDNLPQAELPQEQRAAATTEVGEILDDLRSIVDDFHGNYFDGDGHDGDGDE
jgi:methyl-accepting chemotaxis protein